MVHYGGNSRKLVVAMSKTPAFQPINTIPTEALKRVRVLLTDIDDTLTTDGRLTADAYGAMERLESACIAVAPVTGRPAGWCDHIARMWPVAGVIGENGALYFRYDRADRSMHRVYAQNETTRAANRKRLEAIATDTLAELEAEGLATIIPTARATQLTMNREGIRRLAAEELGLATSPYRFADTYEDYCEAISEIG